MNRWEDLTPEQRGRFVEAVRSASRALRELAVAQLEVGRALVRQFEAAYGPDWHRILLKQARRERLDDRRVARLMRIRDRRAARHRKRATVRDDADRARIYPLFAERRPPAGKLMWAPPGSPPPWLEPTDRPSAWHELAEATDLRFTDV